MIHGLTGSVCGFKEHFGLFQKNIDIYVMLFFFGKNKELFDMLLHSSIHYLQNKDEISKCECVMHMLLLSR